MLQHLSAKHAADDPQSFRRSLDWGIRLALFIAVPMSLLMILLPEPIVWCVFGYGKFTVRDVQMASLSLASLASGITVFFLVKVLAAAYFSRQDTRSPVRAGIICMVSNMILNAIIVGAMVWFGYHAPHAGLGIASALAALLNAALLYRWLKRDGIYQLANEHLWFVLKLLCAGLVLAAVAWMMRRQFHSWEQWRAHIRFAHFLLIAGTAGLSYLVVLWVLGVRPRDFIDRTEQQLEAPVRPEPSP
jgi:putative peptidoglycan lipid II flippase